MRLDLKAMALLLGAWVGVAASAPALADGLQEEPLARFEEPVCPGIIGLQVEAAEQMVGRIRENAEAFDLDLADPESCDPNIVIAFLADGQAYLRRLADDRPHLFQDLTTAERRELLDEAGPVRAWINTQVRTRDGMQVGRRDDLVSPPSTGMWSAHSRIYRPVRRDIDSVMVLFDRDAISGLSLAQLADYATMRSFARTYPEEADGGASILSLFDERDTAPTGLTALDEAFLTRLYQGIPNLPASARLEGLAGEADK
jgi:hypothetical protein